MNNKIPIPFLHWAGGKTAYLLALLVSLFTTFCSGIIRHDTDENKYYELANQPQFDCVGLFFSKPDSAVGGSCVLIKKNYILTAAHCCFTSDYDTIRDNKGNLYYLPNNRRLVDAKDLEFNFNNKTVMGKKIILHPNYTDAVGDFDLAIIELEKPIDNIVLPELNNEKDELNFKVFGIGYGAFGIANRPETVNANNYRKIGGENTIDKILGHRHPTTKDYTLLAADFDSPSKCKKCNKMGNAIPQALEYIPSGGDSGGGLFRIKNNKWQLIGICSGSGIDVKQLFKTGYYGQICEWTRVSVFYNWIQENTKE